MFFCFCFMFRERKTLYFSLCLTVFQLETSWKGQNENLFARIRIYRRFNYNTRKKRNETKRNIMMKKREKKLKNFYFVL